jgi:hypothetical protein
MESALIWVFCYIFSFQAVKLMTRYSLHLIAVTMLFLYPSDGYIILPPFPKLFLRQPIEIFDAIGIQC